MSINHNRWAKQTVAVLLVFLFLAVSATAILSYRISTDRLQRELTHTNMALLRQIKDKMELTLRNLDKETSRLLTNTEIRKFMDNDLAEDGERRDNRNQVNGFVFGLVNNNSFVVTVDLYSYNQKRLLSSSPLLEFSMQDDYRWIEEFARSENNTEWLPTRRLMIDNSAYSIYQNVITLLRTYPLMHAPGFRRGAVAVNIKEDSLFHLIQDPEEQGADITFVIDKTGKVLLHPDKAMLGTQASELPYIEKLLKGGSDEGSFSTSVDRADISVFYVTSSFTGWKLVRVVPVMQLKKPLVHVRNTLLAVSIALFVAAALAAFLVNRWTFKPVNRFIYKLLNDSERLQRQIKEGKPFMKWRLLMDLLTNNPGNDKNLDSYMELVGVTFFPNRFVVMSVEFDNKHEIASPRDLHLYAYALCNIAEEIIRAESKGAAIEREDGQCVFIVSFDDRDDADKLAIRAAAIAELIKNCAQEYLKKTVTIGIGTMVDARADIPVSYKQSLEAQKYRLIMGGNSIIAAEDIHDFRFGEYNRFIAMTDSMVDSLKLLDSEKLWEQVGTWFDSFAQQNVPPDMIKQLALQFLLKAVVVAEEIGADPEELVPLQDIYETLSRFERLGQIRDHAISVLIECIERIKAKRGNRDKNELIEKITAFIERKYMLSDLSLNYIANEFHVSLSHLSRMFKEYTGENFIDYLTEVRMNTAKKLLAERNDKIREVAEKVGYTNVNSFIRIFKKSTGFTPNEYREREWTTPE